MRVLVTGAAGFVGRPCCQALTAAGHDVTAVVRTHTSGEEVSAARVVALGDLTAKTEWSEVLAGIDCVVHLVARTHMVNETADVEHLYTEANVGVLTGLAEAAVRAGVRRFVFVSSIKVNGEATYGVPFKPHDVPAPADAYGRSKAQAEGRLRKIAARNMEFVILRPPLMYGPGVRGNIARLFSLVDRGLPLPFARIKNARDMLSVRSFAHLIALSVDHPDAKNCILLARDGAPVSTPVLVREIAAALGRKPRLVPMPVAALKALGRCAGRSSEIERLVGDLEVDDTETRTRLGWQPAIRMDEAVAETAHWFKKGR